MRLLLQQGVEIDSSSKADDDSSYFGSALSLALLAGNDDAARCLLDSGAESNLCGDAITSSSNKWDVKVMKKLIDRGLT